MLKILMPKRKILRPILASRRRRIILRTIASNKPLQQTLNINSILRIPSSTISLLRIRYQRSIIIVKRKFQRIRPSIKILDILFCWYCLICNSHLPFL